MTNFCRSWCILQLAFVILIASMDNSEDGVSNNCAKLCDWFVEVCKCAPALALTIATELVDVCGISAIEDFPVLYEMDPLWLDQLTSCKLPNLTKILINSNVEKIGKTPLRFLNVDDVAEVVNSCFVEFPYGQHFIDNAINGFTLAYVDDVSKLKEFGITHEIHAATLLNSINTWKRVGVPNELLNFNRRAVKEESVKAIATPDQVPMAQVGVSSAAGAAGAVSAGATVTDTATAATSNDNRAVEHTANQDDGSRMEHECDSVISVDAPSVEMVCVQQNKNSSGAPGSSTQEPIYITSSSASNTSDDGHSAGAKDDTASHGSRGVMREHDKQGDQVEDEVPKKRVAARTIQSAPPRKFARTAMPSHALLASDISVGGRIGHSGADGRASPVSPGIATPSSTAHCTPVTQRKVSTAVDEVKSAGIDGKTNPKATTNDEEEASICFSSSEEEGESRGPSPCGSFGDSHADYEDENRERFGPWSQFFGEPEADGASDEKNKPAEEVNLLDDMELSVDDAIVADATASASAAGSSAEAAKTVPVAKDAHTRFVDPESDRRSASSAVSMHLTSTQRGAAEVSELTEPYDANLTGSSNGSGSSSESAAGCYALRPNRRLNFAQLHNAASTTGVVTPSAVMKKAAAAAAAAAAARPAKSGQQGREAASVKKGLEALKTACNNILNSREDKVLSHAVTYIGVAASKPGRESIDYIVDSGAYRRLLHFVHLALQLPTSFVYYVLRTVSLIVTRLDGIHEVLILLEGSTMKDILKLCKSKNDFVRQQALHLVSEIGVSPDNGLKQKVLKSGAVKVVIESYHDVSCFHAPKTVRRIQGQCATALYKLCSMSTPEQFHYFRPALPVVMDLLTSHTAAWDAVVEAAQAVTFLVVAEHPEQIDVLMEHKIFDTLVAIFQDHNKNASLRWHASAFVWSVAKHCSNQQMRSLFKLMGILGQVCQLEDAHPHLRSAALNTMQVMLQRGEYIIQQFVYHRDAIPARVMELLRAHEHPELVHGDVHNANCIIKYASFTLTNAAIGANKDQMLKLLDQGLYPLLFKIIQLQGEPEKEEEAKMKGILALTQVLDLCAEEVLAVQQRAERKHFSAPKAWEFIRNLVIEVVVPSPIPFAGQLSGASSSMAQDNINAITAQAASVGGGGDVTDSDEGVDDGVTGTGVDTSPAAAVVPPGGAVFRWSAQLQDKAQALVDAARALELFD